MELHFESADDIAVRIAGPCKHAQNVFVGGFGCSKARRARQAQREEDENPAQCNVDPAPTCADSPDQSECLRIARLHSTVLFRVDAIACNDTIKNIATQYELAACNVASLVCRADEIRMIRATDRMRSRIIVSMRSFAIRCVRKRMSIDALSCYRQPEVEIEQRRRAFARRLLSARQSTAYGRITAFSLAINRLLSV
nr:hypothetical protein [Burkholderia stagnalis]